MKSLVPTRRRAVQFSEGVALKILDAVASGETILALSRRRGMPNARTITRWQREHPEFQQAMDEARKVAAGVHGDALVQAAIDLHERARRGKLRKQEAQAFREYSGTLRWFMSRHDPSRYGDRPAPTTTIIINSTLALGNEPATADAEQHGYVVTARPALPKSDD